MSDPELRIVTLNTWKCDGSYARRVELMTRELTGLNPDIVLLQEVFVSADGDLDTARHIATSLQMSVVYAPARAKTRKLEGRSIASTSGLCVLTRYPVCDTQTLPLPTDEADGERIAQIIKLMIGHQSIWIANVHLTHLPAAADLRQAQIECVCAALSRAAGTSTRIIGGDFNAAADSAELATLLEPASGFVNPFGFENKVTHCQQDGTTLDIDHLLVSPGDQGWHPLRAFTALSSIDQKFGITPSDHVAVVVDLSRFPSHMKQMQT
jgi:endonuclease/exonuclease/phosphatase family metal-dependent hydrolase